MSKGKSTKTKSAPASDAPSAKAGNLYEKLYKMLLHSIPSSVLLVDTHMRVVSANRNFLEKARVSESEVIGRPIEDVFATAIYQHMRLRLRLGEVFETGVATRGEQMVYRAPGLPTRTYYYRLIPFTWGSTIDYVMLLMEDVTEQIRLGKEARKAERHLASVVESASDMVVSTDVRGRVLTWNAAATRITGYETREAQHKPFRDFATKSHRQDLSEIVDKGLSVGWSGPMEVEFAGREGQALPVSWVFSAMRDADGRVVGLVAVGRDLTERRKFEARLLQSEKLTALGVMAGGIAHEVRNPLAVISSAAQLLVEKKLSREVQRECADKIFRAAHKASDIVENLLRFARPSDLGVMESLDLAQVVEEALALVANQLRVGRVQLRMRRPDRPVRVRGNAGLLQQLVTNLALNATNAMREKGGTLNISLTEGTNKATLKVSDTGEGIPEAERSKIFDPFFTTMPVGKGTGLGLSIGYAIVEQHEGKINVVSKEGKGTTVTVILPIERKPLPVSSKE